MSFGSRGWPAKSNAPPRLLACLSRAASGASRQLSSMNLRIEVWSSGVLSTTPRRAYGLTSSAGTRNPRPARRPHVVEPSAPLVVGPHERRTPPGLAAGECRDQRPDQRLAGCNTAGRVLAAACRRDVGDRGQRPALDVVVVLIQIDDVAEQLPVADEAREVQERNAYRLRAAVGPPVGGDREARVEVLYVELPGDTARLEPVEDRREPAEATLRDPAAVPTARAGEPEQMVGHAAAWRRSKEAVEQYVLAGCAPVERQVARVVEPHDRELGLLPLG